MAARCTERRQTVQGHINLDVRDSTPDWDAFLADKAPEGAPNVLVVLYDDTGCAAWSPYGGRIEMPTLRPARRQRADLLAVAHDRAVLADALRVPHRPQPPPERLRARSPSPSTGFPGYSSHIPPRERDDGERAARRRLEHVLDRQEPQRAGRRVDDGRVEEGLAARPGLRPLLRLHRRRDQPVVSRPRRGQPLRRPALPARGRLPPLQGPRRQGARASSATPSSPSPTSPGTCGSAPAPTTPRTTRRRSTSTSTRASSTTATRPTASGCCRG